MWLLQELTLVASPLQLLRKNSSVTQANVSTTSKRTLVFCRHTQFFRPGSSRPPSSRPAGRRPWTYFTVYFCFRRVFQTYWFSICAGPPPISVSPGGRCAVCVCVCVGGQWQMFMQLLGMKSRFRNGDLGRAKLRWWKHTYTLCVLCKSKLQNPQWAWTELS